MKKLALIFAAISFLAACTQKNTPNFFSQEALEKELIESGGKSIRLKEIIEAHLGTPTVIEVWASWCPDCIKGFPALKKLQKDFPNFNYVFLSADKTQEDWTSAILKYELEGTHYWIPGGMKGDFGKSIHLDWIPRYIILDKEGEVALYRAIEADEEELIKTLKNLN